MLGKSAAKSSGLGATKTEQAVVRGKHRSVEVHNVGVLVVGENVVEGNVFDDGRAVKDELDVVGAVERGGVPEVEQGLLVLVHRDAWLAQLWVEKGPQVLGVGKVSSHFLAESRKPGKLSPGASFPVSTEVGGSSPETLSSTEKEISCVHTRDKNRAE